MVKGPIFGGRLPVAVGAPRLAALTGAPLLPVFTVRDPKVGWRIVVEAADRARVRRYSDERCIAAAAAFLLAASHGCGSSRSSGAPGASGTRNSARMASGIAPGFLIELALRGGQMKIQQLAEPHHGRSGCRKTRSGKSGRESCCLPAARAVRRDRKIPADHDPLGHMRCALTASAASLGPARHDPAGHRGAGDRMPVEPLRQARRLVAGDAAERAGLKIDRRGVLLEPADVPVSARAWPSSADRRWSGPGAALHRGR